RSGRLRIVRSTHHLDPENLSRVRTRGPLLAREFVPNRYRLERILWIPKVVIVGRRSDRERTRGVVVENEFLPGQSREVHDDIGSLGGTKKQIACERQWIKRLGRNVGHLLHQESAFGADLDDVRTGRIQWEESIGIQVDPVHVPWIRSEQ